MLVFLDTQVKSSSNIDSINTSATSINSLSYINFDEIPEMFLEEEMKPKLNKNFQLFLKIQTYDS